MKAEKTLADILGDFPTKDARRGREGERPVTLWIPEKEKDRYDRLQKMSRRRFAAKVREAVIELIELADRLAG